MNKVYYGEMDSPVGPLYLAATEKGVCHVGFGRFVKHRSELESRLRRFLPEFALLPGSPLLDRAREQLTAYFHGQRQQFDLPLDLYGTPFQIAVWQALRTIRYGTTRSYGDIARQVGRPKAARAVGGANNRNPVSVIVPCHRVIGSDGALVGYGGGLSIKKMLLAIEERVNV